MCMNLLKSHKQISLINMHQIWSVAVKTYLINWLFFVKQAHLSFPLPNSMRLNSDFFIHLCFEDEL